MIEMSREQSQAQAGSDPGQAPEQGRGVGAAREGDDHAVPWNLGSGPEETLQMLEKIHEGVRNGGGDGTRTHDLAVMSRSL